MESIPETAEKKKRQTVWQRLFWFLAGAGLNYLLIATPFKYLRQNTDLSVWAVSACSIGVSTTFFFLWNYFVNFRTDSRKRDALLRYVCAVFVMWFAGSSLLALFKHYNAQLHLRLGGVSLDLDVITTQLCLGWLKFLVYHKWVFPVAKE